MEEGTYLGLDVGRKRLGVAVGESVTGSARPLAILDCRDGQPDWSELERLLRQWHPRGLVVGVPSHADGSTSRSTVLAETFAQRLEGRTGLRIYRIDERLSSHEAGERRRTAGRRGRRATAPVDDVAAQIILETWFCEQGIR